MPSLRHFIYPQHPYYIDIRGSGRCSTCTAMCLFEPIHWSVNRGNRKFVSCLADAELFSRTASHDSDLEEATVT